MAALERFRINAKTKVRELSKGQSKQVSLALALASEPELLILDDPTLGLDPRQGTDPSKSTPPPAAAPMVQLVDAATGAMRLGAAPSVPGATLPSAWLLEDGRLAVVEQRSGHLFLRVVGTDGHSSELALGNGEAARIEMEVANGLLVVGVAARLEHLGRGFVTPWRTISVNTHTLAILHSADRLRPISVAWMAIGAGMGFGK